MRIFLKYLLWLLSFLTLLIFFVFSTQLGGKTVGYFLGHYLSGKTHNKIEVNALSLKEYPILTMDITINDGAKVHLLGRVNRHEIEMNYHLQGEGCQWNDLVIEKALDISGDIKGLVSDLKIEGRGEIFEGNITFNFRKVSEQYRDVHVVLTEVESAELLRFLKQKPLLKGKINIKSDFKLYSKYKKEGVSMITMREGFMPTVAPHVPFRLTAQVKFEDFLYRVEGKIDSQIGSLLLKNTSYHTLSKEGRGNFELNLHELAYFKTFLKHEFRGALETKGVFTYKENKLMVQGKTDKFEGKLSYFYRDKKLDLKLEALSLVKILKQFDYPALLSSKVFGTIEYEMENKIIILNTKLREARFRATKLTKMISDATGFNILSDVYDDSSFVGGYQNERLDATLKVDNGVNHFYLDELILNRTHNTINSKFNVRVGGQQIYGKIYGTLQNPSVSVDMKRLIQSQIEKGIESLMGTSSKEDLKKELKLLKGSLRKNLEDLFQ